MYEQAQHMRESALFSKNHPVRIENNRAKEAFVQRWLQMILVPLLGFFLLHPLVARADDDEWKEDKYWEHEHEARKKGLERGYEARKKALEREYEWRKKEEEYDREARKKAEEYDRERSKKEEEWNREARQKARERARDADQWRHDRDYKPY